MKTTLATLQNFFPEGYRVFDVEHKQFHMQGFKIAEKKKEHDCLIARAKGEGETILFVVYTEYHQKTGLLPRVREESRQTIHPDSIQFPATVQNQIFEEMVTDTKSW